MQLIKNHNFKSSIRTLYRVLIVLVPFVLVFLPVNFFDQGPTICISKLITDVDCPGCGITRAVQHCIHLDFKTAWNYNKMFVLVVPLLSMLYIQEVRKSWKYFQERF